VTTPPTQPLSLQVPSGARCATHADRPAEFACARCGNFACAECKHPAGEGQLFCSACADFAAGEIPLEKRNELGLAKAVGLTVVGVLLKPWEFFAARSREPSLWPPLLFATAMNVPVSLTYAVVNMFTLEAQLAETRSNPAFDTMPFFREYFELLLSPGSQVAMALVGILFYPLWYFVVGGLQWGAHWLVGARGASYRDVVRAVMYLQATSLGLLLLAPVTLVLTFVSAQLAGMAMWPYLFGVLVWLVIAMWKVQRTEIWRPVVAQGLLAIFCCCLPMLLIFVGTIAVVGAAVGGR
jgi:hypothetical protein